MQYHDWSFTPIFAHDKTYVTGLMYGLTQMEKSLLKCIVSQNSNVYKFSLHLIFQIVMCSTFPHSKTDCIDALVLQWETN